MICGFFYFYLWTSTEFTVTTTDHCAIGKEMLSKNGSSHISMICEIFGENYVHFPNTQDPMTEILMLCHEDAILLETTA